MEVLHLDLEDLQVCHKVSKYKGSYFFFKLNINLSTVTGFGGCNLYFVIRFLQFVNRNFKFYDSRFIE